MEKKRYDVDLIKQSISIEEVINSLDIPVQRKGQNTSILCPHHRDNNFGNCKVKNEHYYCFACNEGGDVINLVMAHCDVGFVKALEIIANISGNPDCFLDKEGKYESFSGMISREKQRKIGIGFENTPIYGVDGKLLCYNPLKNLYENDKVLYKNILIKALEKKKSEIAKQIWSLNLEPSLALWLGDGAYYISKTKEYLKKEYLKNNIKTDVKKKMEEVLKNELRELDNIKKEILK